MSLDDTLPERMWEAAELEWKAGRYEVAHLLAAAARRLVIRRGAR